MNKEEMNKEEMKLKKKAPHAVRPGGSLFLQKKLLQRDKKYFDSGDYNMARGQAAKGPQVNPLLQIGALFAFYSRFIGYCWFLYNFNRNEF